MQIDRAVGIPVIVDCDTGYGNALNVIRTTQDLEAMGIAGMCIEDNTFPKKCSFYESVPRSLDDPRTFINKIKAAKENQLTKDFFVIARTEALIQGNSVSQAIKRAEDYAAAGADSIVIHSKDATGRETKQIAKSWREDIPLTVIPTKFPQFSTTDLGRMGYKMIIYANHPIRAAAKAVNDMLGLLKSSGTQQSINESLFRITDLDSIVGVDKLASNEKKYA